MKTACAAALLAHLLLGTLCRAQDQFPQVDAIVDEAVRTDVIPGAVVAIGHNGRIVYQKAYGSRALIPTREAMTLDTIFDAASLTKVVATTPSIVTLKCGEEPAAIVNVAFAVASVSPAVSSSENVYATVPVGAGIATVHVSPDAPWEQFPPLAVDSVTVMGLIFAIAGGSDVLPSTDVMSTFSSVVFGET